MNDYFDTYGYYNVSEDYVLEEVLADYYAGIDIYAGTENAQKDIGARSRNVRETVGSRGEALSEAGGETRASREMENGGKRGGQNEESGSVPGVSSTFHKISGKAEGAGLRASDRRRRGEVGPLGYGRVREYGGYSEEERSTIDSFLDTIVDASPQALKEIRDISRESAYLSLYELMQYDDRFVQTNIIEEGKAAQEALIALESYLDGLGDESKADLPNIREKYTSDYNARYARLAEDFFGVTGDLDQAGWLDVNGKLLDFKSRRGRFSMTPFNVLKGAGLSIRQIERLTGINRNTVQKV